MGSFCARGDVPSSGTPTSEQRWRCLAWHHHPMAAEMEWGTWDKTHGALSGAQCWFFCRAIRMVALPGPEGLNHQVTAW